MPGKVTFISYYPITQTPGERLCNSENSSWAQRKPKERKGSSHLGQNGDTLHQLHPRGSSAFLLLSPSPHLMFLLSSLIFLQVFSFSYMTCWQLARESSRREPTFQETLPHSQLREDREERWQRLRRYSKYKQDWGTQTAICPQKQMPTYPIHT